MKNKWKDMGAELIEKEVAERIQELKASLHDPEAAHASQDALCEDFIVWVGGMSKGGMIVDLNAIKAVAKQITEVLEMDFPRWCA